jgi:hypothetical protein
MPRTAKAIPANDDSPESLDAELRARARQAMAKTAAAVERLRETRATWAAARRDQARRAHDRPPSPG